MGKKLAYSLKYKGKKQANLIKYMGKKIIRIKF